MEDMEKEDDTLQLYKPVVETSEPIVASSSPSLLNDFGDQSEDVNNSPAYENDAMCMEWIGPNRPYPLGFPRRR